MSPWARTQGTENGDRALVPYPVPRNPMRTNFFSISFPVETGNRGSVLLPSLGGAHQGREPPGKQKKQSRCPSPWAMQLPTVIGPAGVNNFPSATRHLRFLNDDESLFRTRSRCRYDANAGLESLAVRLLVVGCSCYCTIELSVPI